MLVINDEAQGALPSPKTRIAKMGPKEGSDGAWSTYDRRKA